MEVSNNKQGDSIQHSDIYLYIAARFHSTVIYICIGYTMRMRGYRIYTTEGEARGRVYSMTLNPNCITGLYQNAEAFPFPIGSSQAVQCNYSVKMAVTRTPPYRL